LLVRITRIYPKNRYASGFHRTHFDHLSSLSIAALR
jgi:hypothetical protein